ncbi:hypothetical protein ACQR1I_36615 [Bradyrhizobium sp. HKCCYLS2038]|uniref:hypothetical protein n=1 Tax=unclassified Bradyrhizobium TaxID=2631580 RepID=UPI003EC1555A
MNLAQLEALLTPVDGTVTVTGGALSSASITTVLDLYFGAMLVISGAETTVDQETQSVLVSGTITLVALSMDARATFTLQHGIPQLILNAQESGTPAWSFAQSFGPMTDPLLAQLSFATPSWTLRSVAGASQPAGLWLDAVWTPPPLLEAIAWLFGGNLGQMAVAGPLQVISGLPQAAFAVGPPQQQSIGGIGLTLQLTIVSLVSAGITPLAPSTCTGSYELVTTLSNSSGTVTVPASAILTSNFAMVTISADTGRAVAVTVGQIAEWIGGNELEGQGIPAGIDTAGLSLTLFHIVISVQSQKIISVTGALSVAGAWSIIPNVLTVGGVSLNLYVSDPFGSSRSFSSTVTGMLSLDVSGGEPIVIDVAAQFPNFALLGSLPDENDSPPSLAGMMAGSHGVGSSAGFGNTLTIASLNILAVPSASTYTFEINVTEDWQLLEDLTLFDVGVRIVYAKGDLSAVLEVGLDLAGINIALAADYDSSTGGWLLTGKTGPGQTIAIGDLVADMLARFGATTTLPDSLAGLVIDNLTISFNTQSFDVSLGLETRFPIGGQALDAVIAIDYAKTQTGGYAVDFSGVVNIDNQQFALVFDDGSSS